MSIVSLEFLLFTGIVAVLYFLVPGAGKKYILLAASYFYYWAASQKLIVFLLVSTLVIYLSGLVMGKIDSKVRSDCEGLDKKEKKAVKAAGRKKKSIVVFASVAINLGLLILLKYINFLGGIANSVFHTSIPVFDLLLPMGISYYTLQAISYSVDVYRGSCKPSRNIVNVALYLSFFPHILEGPFSRFADVGEQLTQPHAFNYQRVKFGLQLMIWGYFKKMVVADRAAQYVTQALSTSAGYTGLIVILGVILYTVQLYAEFSGCIDIMTGIAQVLGIQLPSNFRQPFFAKTVQEFWQRWHITLGTWFKEYIFFPVSCSKSCIRLAGTANKLLPTHLARIVPAAMAMLCVWLCNGFWHGASWKYVFYGLYYYGLMILGMVFEPVFKKIIAVFKIRTDVFSFRLWQMFRTTVLVLGGMLIFAADSFGESFRLFKRIFSFEHFDMLCNGAMFDLGLEYNGEWIILAIGVLIIFVVDLLHERGHHLRETLAEQPLLFRWLIYYGALFAILIFGVYGMGYDAQAFIYAGF